jgi:uncharacterized protein YyaL (SSP411 family)
MLYDNAQLALAYLHGWQVTGASRYLDVVVETLDFLERELLVREGDAIVGFASSLDADTGGVEGATYVWTQAQIRAVLGADAPLVEAAYGVTANGNWEGTTILSRVRDDTALARDLGLDPAVIADRLATARRSLAEARSARPQPARDDKVLASWNGLALAALAEAAQVAPGGERYAELATGVARSLRQRLRAADGRLHRSWTDGRPGPHGVLEDHTHLAAGLLALYQSTFDETWYGWAVELMRLVLERFADQAGGFRDTPDDATDLFARPRSLVDGAIPSGNAMAATVMASLHGYTGDATWADASMPLVARMTTVAARHPNAFPQWLAAIGRWSVPMDEVAITGEPTHPDTRALLDVVREGLRPWQVVACAAHPQTSSVPLLQARDARDQATAWVCHGGACRLPVTSAAALRGQLRGGAT